MRDDREREQQRGNQCRSDLVAANGTRERRRAEDHAQANRGHNKRQIPSDASRHLERPHAGVVHRADAGTHYHAADQRSPKPGHGERYRKPDAGHCRRRQQRQRGQANIVGNRNAGLVGEHGDEMRRPDAATGGDAGGGEPRELDATSGGAGAMKQIDGSETGQEADQRCKQDESPIVLDREAVEYPEHGVLAC